MQDFKIEHIRERLWRLEEFATERAKDDNDWLYVACEIFSIIQHTRGDVPLMYLENNEE